MNEKYIKEIIQTIVEFKWEIKNMWVEKNCIYATVQNQYGKIVDEGLYAGSDFDTNNVYEVCGKLRYIMNFNGMLEDDNIMI